MLRGALKHAAVHLNQHRFSNVLVWTVENASKLWCGRESIDAFSICKEIACLWNWLVLTGLSYVKPFRSTLPARCQMCVNDAGTGLPYYTRYLFAPPRKAIHRYTINIGGSKAEGTVTCRYIRLHYSVVTKSLFLMKQTEGLYRNFALRKE